MDGTTNVPTVNQYVIIHRMQVLTKGATNVNVGTITATADTDGTITAQIQPGNGQTLMAIYGVPSVQVAYMTGFYASVVKAAAAVTASVKILVNPEPDAELTNFLTKHILGLDSQSNNLVHHSFNPCKVFPGPSIIKIQGNASAANTIMSAGFDLILEEV
jgi:hypothetical protein